MKYLLGFILLCCLSCTKQPQKPQASYIIHIDSMTQTWPAPTNIEYIPLETNDSSLIGRINKVVFCNDLFYVFDQTGKKVVLFDRQGKFFKSIHKIGQGPGEYTDPYDMDVDNKGNVYLSDITNQNILVYKNGDENKYETIHIGEYFLDFAVKGNLFFLGTIYREGIPKINLASYNKSTDELTVLKENQLPEGDALPLANHYFYRSGEEIFYQERFRPTIYQLQEDGNTSVAIQLETSTVPSREEIAEWAACNPMEQMQKRFLYFSDVTSCHENNSYILLTTTATKVLFNKNNKKTYCTKGLPENAKLLGRPTYSICENKFVSYLAPTDENLKDLLSETTDEQKEKLSSLSEEDNPILVLFNFKE